MHIAPIMDNPENNQEGGDLRISTLCTIEKMLTIVNDPRESNCRRFRAGNCRENFPTRFHVRVKYVDSHCRQVSDSKPSSALESCIV